MSVESKNKAEEPVEAKFAIGQIVKHRFFAFRGVVFDVDPEFSNSEEWYDSIPAEIRPTKDQPYYHLLAQNETGAYEAYVSEQNLLNDAYGGPVDHPAIEDMFNSGEDGGYILKPEHRH